MSVEGFNDIPLSDKTTRAIAGALTLARQALQNIPRAPQTENYAIGLDAARLQIKSACTSLEHLLQRATRCN